MKLTSKKHFYEAALNGLCGNTPIMWRSFDEYYPHRHEHPVVGVRSLQSQSLCIPEITCEELELMEVCGELKDKIISEIPPAGSDTGRGIQGELSWGRFKNTAGWVLYYADQLGYMREMLKQHGQHAFGFDVKQLLGEHFDCLTSLFDRCAADDYESLVIEFAVLNKPMGREHKRLVVWEVRNGY